MFVFLICLCDLVFYFNDLQLKAIFSKKKIGVALKRAVGFGPRKERWNIISGWVGVANQTRDHASTQPPRTRQAPPPPPSPLRFQNTCRGSSRGFLVWIWYAGRDICSSLGDSRITGTLRHDDCFLPGRCNMSGTYRRWFLSPTLKHPRCATSSNSPLSRLTTMMTSFSRSSRCSKSSGR